MKIQLTKTDIQGKIAELGSEQPWNHNILLTHGIETSPKQQVSHGKNLVKWKRIKPILNMLDVTKLVNFILSQRDNKIHQKNITIGHADW